MKFIWGLLHTTRAQTKRGQKTSLRPMTHSPQTGAINQLYFFTPVSGTCVMLIWVTGFIWYQILAPIRTLFHSKPYIASLIERGPSGRDVMGPLPYLPYSSSFHPSLPLSHPYSLFLHYHFPSLLPPSLVPSPFHFP